MSKSLRTHACEVIYALQNQQSNLDALIKKHGRQLSVSDQRHLQALCYGICREWFHLAEIESQLLDKPLKARDQILSAIVRCGLYELGWMRSKDYAVVSEYVNVTVIEGRPWARGLINAVLRQFIRKQSELKMQRQGMEALWNHPTWLIESIQSAWPEHWERVLVENNVHPPMTLRINRSKTTVASYISQLVEAGIDCVGGSAPDSVRLAEPVPVNQLPGFNDGIVSVQDESSQWASIALDPNANERILDACAAPGGKTCHLLEMTGCEVTALDISEQRLALIKENLVRLGLRAHLHPADASQTDGWWDGIPFDALLIDLPCSATGVIRRHPDVRLMRSKSALRSLTGMQTKILDAVWNTLKPGGRALVTTCSILPQENDEQIENFLAHHADASRGDLTHIPGIQTPYGIQQLPDHSGGDGFYYALLVKSGAKHDRNSA